MSVSIEYFSNKKFWKNHRKNISNFFHRVENSIEVEISKNKEMKKKEIRENRKKL